MTKIYVGRINSFHGIKGDLKILSDFELRGRVFKKGIKIFIDNKEHVISSSKIHKNNYLITIDELKDINLVDKYLHKDIFIDREALKLRCDEFIATELIGFIVYDKEDIIGEVINVVYNVNSKYLYISGSKNFYLPIIDKYIDLVDTVNKKIYTKGGKDLII